CRWRSWEAPAIAWPSASACGLEATVTGASVSSVSSRSFTISILLWPATQTSRRVGDRAINADETAPPLIAAARLRLMARAGCGHDLRRSRGSARVHLVHLREALRPSTALWSSACLRPAQAQATQ